MTMRTRTAPGARRRRCGQCASWSRKCGCFWRANPWRRFARWRRPERSARSASWACRDPGCEFRCRRLCIGSVDCCSCLGGPEEEVTAANLLSFSVIFFQMFWCIFPIRRTIFITAGSSSTTFSHFVLTTRGDTFFAALPGKYLVEDRKEHLDVQKWFPVLCAVQFIFKMNCNIAYSCVRLNAEGVSYVCFKKFVLF